MQKYCAVTVTVGMLLCCGCHHWGYYPKRQSELNCPTDIRQTIPWCAGEDAVFRCPCGPSPHFYGHKPTCWGNWPAPGPEWRDSYCGCPIEYSIGEELSVPIPLAKPLPESVEPQSGSNARRPVATPPAEQQAEPLFVPPQPTASEQSRTQNARFQGSRTSLGETTSTFKRRGTNNAQRRSDAIRQVCHTEEMKLEPHAWTGIKFIR
jgi:hypothetical protein